MDPLATGFSPGEGRPELGVTLLGEALGESEAKLGRPFMGPAGMRLGRMIERAGFKREQFQILNTISCRPPNNNFSPDDAYFDGAMAHCRQHWEPQVKRPETKVIVPMGNVPLKATLDLEGILSKRGYVWWSDQYDAYVLPTVHPSYIMRGNSAWEAAWIYDLRHAVEIAQDGWSPIERDYLLDPPPPKAWAWARSYRDLVAQDVTLALGYDIETPDKSAAEDETDINLGYLPGPIYRISFAYVWRGRTYALSIPWDSNYLELIGFLFATPGPKIVANRHFDVPRINAHGVSIAGDRHDVQEMWHVLHSALPKKLEHIVPFLCPRQPAWKHLSGSQPALYNAIDSAVEVEAYYRLIDLLTEARMWETYHRDIFQLNPILLYMTEQGMPVDEQRRKEAAWQIGELKAEVRVKLNEAAEGARPTKVYKKAKPGLTTITIQVEEKYCSECGKPKVSAKHPCFKVGQAEGEVPLGELKVRTIDATGWVEPLDFKPSNTGLLRYAKFKGYRLFSRYDKQQGKRVYSMDESSLRKYALAHPEDPIFALALEERELTKLAGTYIGVLTEEPPKQLTAEQEYYQAVNRAKYADYDTAGSL